jgi:PAS domain-containing protein
VLEMLGIRVDALTDGAKPERVEGWDEKERERLRDIIASRMPFVDFVFSRVTADGAVQRFQVSGEPMFDSTCRFIGYRGIGMALSPGT